MLGRECLAMFLATSRPRITAYPLMILSPFFYVVIVAFA